MVPVYLAFTLYKRNYGSKFISKHVNRASWCIVWVLSFQLFMSVKEEEK